MHVTEVHFTKVLFTQKSLFLFYHILEKCAIISVFPGDREYVGWWRSGFAKPREMLPCSSMVEQEAVNFKVAGSSPAGAAIFVGRIGCIGRW